MLKSPVLSSYTEYRTWAEGVTRGAGDAVSDVSRRVRDQALAAVPPSYPCVAVVACGPGRGGIYCEVDFVPALAGGATAAPPDRRRLCDVTADDLADYNRQAGGG